MAYVGTKLQKELSIEELYTVHYFEYSSTYRYPGEKHDFWECVYVDRGEVVITAGEEELCLSRGEILFHAPNEWHTLRANGTVAPNLVVLSFSSHSPIMESFRGFRASLDNRGKALISSIIRESEEVFSTPLGDPSTKQLEKRAERPFGGEQMILSRIEELLVLLLRAEREGQRPALRRHAEGSICEQMIAYMRENLDKNLSLAALSRFAGVSESTVKAIFRAGTGKGALAYFIDLKMDTAKTYIREGRYNVTEIAELLGYESIHYFSRRFRLRFGMSPSEYAQSIKAIEEKK